MSNLSNPHNLYNSFYHCHFAKEESLRFLSFSDQYKIRQPSSHMLMHRQTESSCKEVSPLALKASPVPERMQGFLCFLLVESRRKRTLVNDKHFWKCLHRTLRPHPNSGKLRDQDQTPTPVPTAGNKPICPDPLGCKEEATGAMP